MSPIGKCQPRRLPRRTAGHGSKADAGAQLEQNIDRLQRTRRPLSSPPVHHVSPVPCSRCLPRRRRRSDERLVAEELEVFRRRRQRTTLVPPPRAECLHVGTFLPYQPRRAMSASLIGHSGSSAFRLSTTTVSMSLTGSCFSSESAPGALPSWDSRTRRNNLSGGLAVRRTVGPSGHANSPHPSSREGHHSTARWSSSVLLLD